MARSPYFLEPVVPDRLGRDLMFHMTGCPTVDAKIMKNFSVVFGIAPKAVETFLLENNFLPSDYRVLH